jgi:uncharacterized protein
MEEDSSLAFIPETSYIMLREKFANASTILSASRMEQGTRRIRIVAGSVSLEAELKSNRTADAVYAALPIETAFNTWGEEFYFKIPGVKDHRETATTQVKVGDLAFWGAGEMLAIFFGRTPMSRGAEPVPADRVNVIGRILGDATRLREAMNASKIRVEKV